MDESIVVNCGPASSPAAVRECGECTACCTVLAVNELQKPRWTCDHVSCHGCQVYTVRPESCREFNCLWLRGGLASDVDLRPDRLGVMFDEFFSLASNSSRCVAFELWKGALEEPQAAGILETIATEREVDLSYRDGTWRTIGATVTALQVAPAGESRETGENCTTGEHPTDFDRI